MGALTWFIQPFLGDIREPFDNETGFYAAQLIMVIYMLSIGWKTDFKRIFLALFGLYVGQVTYAIFQPFFMTSSGSEARVWSYISIFSVLLLCVYPLFAGFLSRFLKLSYAYLKK